MRRTDRDPFPSSPGPRARRGLTLVTGLAALALAAAATLFGGLERPARAQGDDAPEKAAVEVIEVSGLLDDVMADFIEDSIDTAERRGSIGLVLQTDSHKAVVSDRRLAELADRIAGAEVPVSMWVGPSGARASGRVGQLAGAAADLALAPGSRFGNLGEQVLPRDRFGTLFGDAYDLLRDATVGFEAAIELGLAREAPTLGYFVLGLEGFEYTVEGTGEAPVRVPVTPVRFNDLSLADQLLHTVAAPAVAYLLLLVGGGLIVLELYTAGVGIAGGVGALSFLGAGYGLGVLPTRGWAVGLLILAFVGYAIDVQAGAPRTWTVIASVCLVVGSLFLFDGTPAPWFTLAAGIGGLGLGMAWAMPIMVRSRFGTPTIGREWMIGEMGTARDDIAPEGVVTVREAPWRARVNRATPIPAGDPVRVVAIDGLLLEVEPAEGGARDYRDRARS